MENQEKNSSENPQNNKPKHLSLEDQAKALPEDLKRGSISWMAQNPVAANLLMVVLLVGGLMMSTLTVKDVFPSFSLGMITVSVSYSGATPEEMEKSVVLAVEQAAQDVEGIKESNAFMSSGYASVTFEIDESFDEHIVLQDMKAAIDRISTLPDEAEKPIVSLNSTLRSVLTYVLIGHEDEHVLRYWADIIKDDLLQSDAIAKVDIEGVRDMEVHVEVPQETLRRYNLKLSDVATAISQSALEQGSGTLRASSGDILMKVDERRDLANDFRDIPIITNPDGSRILVDDVAEISEGFDDGYYWAEFNGKRAVLIDVYKNDSQSPVEVVDQAKAILDRIDQTLPGDLQLIERSNSAKIYADREGLLIANSLTGVFLVFICLAIFLRPSLATWVSLGIPVSVLGAFLFFNPMNLTVNMITMFAFIITLGIVVDDAIVVGENVSAWQERGVSSLEAAIRGTKEVGGPVVFSVLTNILTFLPMMFVPGVMGKIWGAIPLVVLAVFACSLIESLYVLPAHLSHTSAKKAEGNECRQKGILTTITCKQEAFNKKFMYFVEYRFGPLLNTVLKHRYIMLTGSLALLIVVGAYVMSGRMGFDLMPRVESDYAFAEVELPTGAALSEIERIKDHLMNAAQEVVDENGGEALSKGIYVSVSKNKVVGRIFLVDADDRPMSTFEVTDLWRNKTGNIVGAERVLMEADRGGPGSGKGLTVRLSHKSAATLDMASEQLGKMLANYGSIGDIDTGVSNRNRQFDFKILPVAHQLGLTTRDISTQLRNSFEGATALKQQRDYNEVTVRVRLPEEERNQLSTLENLIIYTPTGQEVLLRDVVEILDTKADSVIRHTDGRRTSTVSANVTPASEVGVMMSTVTTDVMPQLMAMYPGLSWTFGGRQADMQDSTNTMIYGLLFALLGIYALLAIPFKSYGQPLIIMCAIPFGIVGAVFGHLIMGYSLSVISIFGIVALSGVVVNDSLVLIDFANIKRRAGMDARRAVYEASIQRFRPILLTTLTTFVGLMPIIFETSRQAKMMIPIALSLGFGILFATVICLLIVPSLYLSLDDAKEAIVRKFSS